VGLVVRMSVVESFRVVLHDGVYRVMDIYLDAHEDLSEREREREEVCRVLSCERMAEEACVHAA